MTSGELARRGDALPIQPTMVETSAELAIPGDLGEELRALAPAAAAALRLLADAIRRGNADQDTVVKALSDADVAGAFGEVLEAAADAEMETLPDDDPFDFDTRLRADNLAGAASDVRRAFKFL